MPVISASSPAWRAGRASARSHRASPAPGLASSLRKSRSARSRSRSATARRVSLLGIAALLLLGGLALAAGRRREDGNEHDRIQARYGPLLLPVPLVPATGST